METNPILYIVLNGSLNMSAGKGAAQAVHAAMLLKTVGLSFSNHYKRTVVVLEAKNGEQLVNLHTYLDEAHIYSDYYIDEGKNEVDAFSITALVVEPIGYDDEAKREIFESFELFGHQDYDDDDCDTSALYQLQAENRELRRLWIETEDRFVKLKVTVDKHLRGNWLKRLLHKKAKKDLTAFVS